MSDYLLPHRGSAILATGGLSLALVALAAPCWQVAPSLAAAVAAASVVAGALAGCMSWIDRQAMSAGRMDPTGRDATRAGGLCGFLGIVMGKVVLFAATAWWCYSL